MDSLSLFRTFLIGVLSLLPLKGWTQGNGYFAYPSIPGSINSSIMNDVGFDGSGKCWVATSNIGAAVFDSSANSWFVLNASGGLPSDSVTSVSFRANDIWIGTKNGAISYSGYPPGGSLLSTYTIPQLPSNVVTEILAETNFIWFGTVSGLARLELASGAWSYYTMLTDTVTKIMRDGFGNLWVGTRNGLFVTDNNGINWNMFSPSNTGNILKPCIYDLEFDGYGRLWVSSGFTFNHFFPVDCSVSYFKNNSFTAFDFGNFELGYVTGSYSGRAINFTKDFAGNVLFASSTQYVSSGQLVRVGECEVKYFELDDILGGFSCGSFGAFGYTYEIMPNGQLWRSSRRAICPVSFSYQDYLLSLNSFALPIIPLSNTCAGCAGVPTGLNEIDINLVKATICSGGDMHWDLSSAKYEVPKGGGKHSVFASSHWIGGMDAGGQLRVAANTYRQTGNDFWPGPLDGMNIVPGDSTAYYFDRVYKVSREEIETFQYQFQNGLVSYLPCNNNVPLGIISWPAKGNGIITGDLAPFVDVDGNGVYNPLTGGDYPDIKGDQMLYKVFNDSLNLHSSSSGYPLGFEFRTSVYGFICDSTTSLSNIINYTTFYNLEVINRSNRNYTDVYFGFWTDMDLGNYNDDYVGCDVGRNTGYTYNGDADDNLPTGYGLNPPIMNLKIMHGPLAPAGDGLDNNNNGTIDESGEYFGMNKFMYFDNVNFTATGNPNDFNDYYNYLRGRWLDNLPLTYGGGGYNPGSTSYCDFMFPGTTDPVNYPLYGNWSQGSGGSVPSDRRMIISSGPFSINAGDTITYDFAYVFSRDSLSGGNLNFSLNAANLDLVQSWFDNNSFPGCAVYNVGTPEASGSGLLIYPNPASDMIYIKSVNRDLLGYRYEVFNILGELVMSGILAGSSIEVSSLIPQVYFLKIQDNNTVWVARFMKN